MRASLLVVCASGAVACSDLPVGKMADETSSEASAVLDDGQPPLEWDASQRFDGASPGAGESSDLDGAACRTTPEHDPALLPQLPAALGVGFDAAKAACDGEVQWACGDFVLRFDAKGCLAGVALAYLGDPLPEGYERCLVGRMASHCAPCAAAHSYRAYVSCTLARALQPSGDARAAP